MNLATLFKSTSDDFFYKNVKGQTADCYDFTTSSSHWNCAMLIILPKTQAKTYYEALLYLLQKQAKSLNIWETKWENAVPTVQEFITNFITERGFDNSNGKEMDTEIFYEKYKKTLAGLTAEPSFEFTKNGESLSYHDLLNAEDLCRVICFDDDWKEENFFIETKTSWMLYHWSTIY